MFWTLPKPNKRRTEKEGEIDEKNRILFLNSNVDKLYVKKEREDNVLSAIRIVSILTSYKLKD